jgi:hypothetical protein
MRSIEAAAIAGIVFSIGFVAALLLMSRAPGADATALEIREFYGDPGAVRPVVIGLQIVPIAMIALLWFIAVIRRRIGDREDKLFSTVFLGGGLMFAALVLVGAAAMGAPAVVADLGHSLPDPDAIAPLQGAGVALLAVYAPRMGSLFILSASTLGLRTGAFPRSLSLLGYALGLSLIVPLPFVPPIRYVFPVWVGISSLVLLFRHHAVPAEAPPAPAEAAGPTGRSIPEHPPVEGQDEAPDED